MKLTIEGGLLYKKYFEIKRRSRHMKMPITVSNIFCY